MVVLVPKSECGKSMPADPNDNVHFLINDEPNTLKHALEPIVYKLIARVLDRMAESASEEPLYVNAHFLCVIGLLKMRNKF